MPLWAWVVAVLGSVVAGYVVWTFNRLVGLSKRADGAWGDIDVQLKRRWDLVPALVETVKGYAGHESSTLREVVEARTRASESAEGRPGGRGGAERSLAAAVGGVFALAEAYPALKASENFLGLQKSLTDVEDHVQYARRYYNAVVRDYNTLTETFPAMLVASAAGFGPRDYFQLDGGNERAAPVVKI